MGLVNITFHPALNSNKKEEVATVLIKTQDSAKFYNDV